MRRILEEDPARDVKVLAIDVDGHDRPTDPARARELLNDLGRPLPILAADERVLVLYGKVMGRKAIPGTPTFFFIDREGIVYSWHVGPIEPDLAMAPIEFLYGVDRYRPDRWDADHEDAKEPPK